jgi:D,D-heptose 1,7-bisphosphate phosphatase
MNRAIFLDRDGVLNYTRSIKNEFKLMEGIFWVLTSIQKLGYLRIVVTNQPDLTRWLLTQQEVYNDNLQFIQYVDDIYICPHDNSFNCYCRKPKPGMLEMAAVKWNINRKESYIVGDSVSDIEAGTRFGCKTVLLTQNNTYLTNANYTITKLENLLTIIGNTHGL